MLRIKQPIASLTMETELSSDLLFQILNELKKQVPQVTLGFVNPPKVRYIYANRQYPDCLWYFWDGGKSAHEPIACHGITGFIKKIDVEEKEFRGKPDLKINIHIDADRPYVIQAGQDTLFAKGLLHTLSKLSVEAFKKPIMIAVKAGETEQVLFGEVYNPATGKAKFAPYDDTVIWSDVLAKVVDRVTQANA